MVSVLHSVGEHDIVKRERRTGHRVTRKKKNIFLFADMATHVVFPSSTASLMSPPIVNAHFTCVSLVFSVLFLMCTIWEEKKNPSVVSGCYIVSMSQIFNLKLDDVCVGRRQI